MGSGTLQHMKCLVLVNELLQRGCATLSACAIRVPANRLHFDPSAVPLLDKLLHQITTRPGSADHPVNLFDCASLQSFGGCRGA
jgi:hypothetical protein